MRMLQKKPLQGKDSLGEASTVGQGLRDSLKPKLDCGKVCMLLLAVYVQPLCQKATSNGYKIGSQIGPTGPSSECVRAKGNPPFRVSTK